MTTASGSPLADTLELRSPSDIEFINLLVYGEPGAGKTHLIGTAMDHELTHPVLLVDVEGGSLTLRRRPGIDVVSVRSLRELENIHKQLYERNDGYYKTVGIDSITELQKLDMRVIMRAAKERRPDVVEEEVPSPREYLINGEHMRRIVRGFRDLPMNTIMTALVATEKDENTGSVSYAPLLPGKLRAEVPGFIDIVGFLRAVDEGDEIKRVLQVVKSRRVVAKDRTDSLGKLVENPTIPMLWDMIHAAESTKQKEKAA